ncbi:AAA family ATPase [Shinella daejeonensis]|uniref:AAA family ATPase n=1 Tax=Shinella daejeonensis TaxID=659017 RepID=UPI0020C782D9|nr:AAA family ATPase [Shinella daejeonensis]MCP8895602.1 AAA family ATPase [Shinella daejeonensis]
MRLDRLDLVRYGKFTDRSLDFGARQPGRPDFHLVHGPNEAGKSTLFSAYLDLLFGIEKSSAYGFLHPYPVMRVGGRLTVAGVVQEAYRIKRNQGSLVTGDERALPDTLFSSVLGGMDRPAYRAMFSLDDESIEKGGEDILRSEGELGAMLFSASSGLSDLAAGLAALKGEADDFYRPQARKHRLGALKGEIEALREERKALDVAARDYGVLLRERDNATAGHATALQGRNELRERLAALERSLDALPLLARLRLLREQLGTFDLGEPPPPGWRALSGELAREEAEIGARAARMDAERLRLCETLAALPDDPAVLEAEPEIASLSGSDLEARFRTADLDLGSREAERDRLDAAVAALLASLGLPPQTDPRTALLPPGAVERLSTLFSRRSGLLERLDAACAERDEAERALAEARRAAGVDDGQGDSSEDRAFDALSLAVRAARAGDVVTRRREARRQVALAEEALAAAGRRLHPWAGDPAALPTLAVPSAALLKDLRTRFETAVDACRQADRERLEREREAAMRGAALEALLKTAGVVGSGEGESLRRARDEAWRSHRARLDAESAATFERALQADDRAVDARLAHADRLSEIRLVERAAAEAEARRDALREDGERVEAARSAVAAEIGRLAEDLGLPLETTVDSIETWLTHRQEALTAQETLARLRIDEELATKEERAAFARLAGLLEWPGPEGASFEEILLAAEDRLAALREARALRHAARDAAERAEERLTERRRVADEAGKAAALWQDNWTGVIAGTWLSGPLAPADPERVGGLLPVLQTLAQRLEQREELEHRIRAMRNDRDDYIRGAGDLAARLGMDAGAPAETMAAIGRRLEAARAGRQRRQELEAAFERLAGDEADLEERRSILEARLAEMFEWLGCGSLVEADRLLDAHRRRQDIIERVDETARDLMRKMRTETVEEAEAALSSVDEAQLAAERLDLATQAEAAEGEVERHHAARVRAEEALAGVAGSDAAAALEERRRTALLEVAEGSRRYLAMRAGALAAEQALRLYRERHRSVMMDRASETFHIITGGQYTGLSTVMEKDSEFLVVNAAGGGSKLARDLSKGTRFQLYLALRVAGYHEIAASRETVPFVADDIMETFDDERALNTLRVMANMAMSGQVIYLTHHQHLRDLAREACPDVSIHEL